MRLVLKTCKSQFGLFGKTNYRRASLIVQCKSPYNKVVVPLYERHGVACFDLQGGGAKRKNMREGESEKKRQAPPLFG